MDVTVCGIVSLNNQFYFPNKKEVLYNLISYRPFYETLNKKGVTEYALIFKHGMSANTLYRMKKGEAITTKTIDTLCFILSCKVSDILEYEEQT